MLLLLKINYLTLLLWLEKLRLFQKRVCILISFLKLTPFSVLLWNHSLYANYFPEVANTTIYSISLVDNLSLGHCFTHRHSSAYMYVEINKFITLHLCRSSLPPQSGLSRTCHCQFTNDCSCHILLHRQQPPEASPRHCWLSSPATVCLLHL